MDIIEALKLFERHATEAQRLSPRTVAAYRSDIRQFSQWLRREDGVSEHVEQLTPADIERYAASRAHVSAATVQRNLAAMSSLLRFLVRRQIVAHNPVELVDKPRCPDSQAQHLTEEHLQKLLAVVDDTRERAILLTLALLGLRRSELLKLDARDVDLSADRIHIRNSKGGKSRVLPIPSDLRPVLQQYLDEHRRPARGALFLGCHGRRLSRSALARLFDQWLNAAGLEDEGLTPHSCRHGAATRWLRAGLNLRDVQLLLGHADISVTARYLHSSVDDIAAEIDAKVPSIDSAGEPSYRRPTIQPVWQDVLTQLTQQQRHALLSVAQSMLGDAGDTDHEDGEGR